MRAFLAFLLYSHSVAHQKLILKNYGNSVRKLIFERNWLKPNRASNKICKNKKGLQ